MLISENILAIGLFMILTASCFQVTKELKCFALNEGQKLRHLTQGLHRFKSYVKRIPSCRQRLWIKNENQEVVLHDSFGKKSSIKRPHWWRERKPHSITRPTHNRLRTLSNTFL